jgi:6-pyruvoyltetrahydropterin/6-carboxytetrahydropterin synthase
MYHVTKHYPHSLGLSACFRQPGATSHCRFWHGYPLAFTFEFASRVLDDNDWVIDFGALKPLKEWLVATFDHKMILRENDPMIDAALQMQLDGAADVVIMPRVGMEAFAFNAFMQCKANILIRGGYHPRVSLTKVTVAEHEGNSASYSEPL